MRSYSEALNYIHSIERFGSKPGLKRILALLEKLDNPHKLIKTIHVAGTNGKGSTCEYINNALIESGFKTGLFISPYVLDFRERIQINNKFISKKDLIKYVNKVKKIAELFTDDHPSEFEIITAIMFLYFKDQNVDYAVIETGLGGRFDSTNVITPLVSVITKISYDHTEFLGDTLEKIAFEKAGIIKQNVPVVVNSQNQESVINVFKDKAKKTNSQIFIAPKKRFELSLNGEFQQQNAAAAYKACQILNLKEENILKGFKKAFLPARIEIINKNPLVIIDGSHNADGALVLKEYIKNTKPVTIMGVMKDKDVDSIIKIIAPISSAVIGVAVKSNGRTEAAEVIAKKAQKYAPAYFAKNYEEAIKKALLLATNNTILICGSLYLASDIRPFVQKFFNSTTK